VTGGVEPPEGEPLPPQETDDSIAIETMLTTSVESRTDFDGIKPACGRYDRRPDITPPVPEPASATGQPVLDDFRPKQKYSIRQPETAVKVKS
jgi:hypothetical protein